MWARLIVAPWWVRWLVAALWVTAGYIGLAALLLPSFFEALGWMWGPIWVAGFSLIATGLLTLAQRPVQRRVAAKVAGLSRPQRSQVVKALRRGEIPSEPQVLAAAIRVGVLSLAYRRRASRTQRVLQWSIPVLMTIAVVLDLVGNDMRQAVLWAAVAVLVVARFGRLAHRARRQDKNLETLRAAAGSPAEYDDEHPSDLPPTRSWVVVPVVVIGALGFGAMVFYGSTRSTPDCRTADMAVDFIASHRDMLDSNLITAGEPGLDKYQDWSDQLQDDARRVSTPDLAAHLRRIAKLSKEAVALVREARPDPPVSLSADSIDDLKTDYLTTISRLVEEDNALAPICHSRR